MFQCWDPPAADVLLCTHLSGFCLSLPTLRVLTIDFAVCEVGEDTQRIHWYHNHCFSEIINLQIDQVYQ